MPTFTVHVPPGIAEDAARADRTVFVREGFSTAAFVFGPLYLVYRRLWLATIAWLIAAAALAVLAHALGLSIWCRMLLFLVLAVLTGLEAGEARRRALGRRGYIASALLVGVTRESAEKLFFGQDAVRSLPHEVETGRRGPVRAGRGGPAVIGMFPEPGDGVPAGGR